MLGVNHSSANHPRNIPTDHMNVYEPLGVVLALIQDDEGSGAVGNPWLFGLKAYWGSSRKKSVVGRKFLEDVRMATSTELSLKCAAANECW